MTSSLMGISSECLSAGCGLGARAGAGEEGTKTGKSHRAGVCDPVSYFTMRRHHVLDVQGSVSVKMATLSPGRE